MSRPSRSSSPFYLFAGGGTGGHLAPGIAVAEHLKRERPDCRIRFAGTGRRVERQMLEPAPFEYSVCQSLPLRDLLRHPLRFMISQSKAYREACRSILTDRPEAIIGLGGFASVPYALAAARHRVPCLLLEQNTIPGRANRWLARWHPICLTFEESARHLPQSARTHLTGNPLRSAIHQLSNSEDSRMLDQPTLLVLGGSLGSRQVNGSMINALDELTEEMAGWQIIHQTGPDGVDDVRAAYSRHGIPHEVAAFFPDLSSCLNRATLVVARAGATTLAELAAVGVPAVLIPYPNATDDHQTGNALFFQRAGAAEIVRSNRRHSAPVDLAPVLKPLILSESRRSEMSRAMKSLAKPNAAADVVLILESLIR